MFKTEEILSKFKLFWQYPAITEKSFYEKNKFNPNFIGFPWATIFDKRYNLNIIYKILIPYIDKNKRYYTCCQHIMYKQFIGLWKALNITTVYISHKTKMESSIDGITLKSCPLYALNFEDEAINKEFNGVDLLNVERDILYSFVGGYQPNYLTDIRPRIFNMKHPKDTIIKNTGMWHLDKLVYNPKQNSKHELNETADHINKTKYYNELLIRSRFTLAPSGSGPNSIRFWEALAAGSIPVLLADSLELPEHDLWKDAILEIKELDLESLPDKINEIENVKGREKLMRENCLKIYNDLNQKVDKIVIKKPYNMVLFTNCHGEKYIEMFKRDTNLGNIFNINYIVSYQQLDNFQHYKKDFEKADVLIINNIKSYNDFTIQNLRKILKDNVLLIVIPFVRFEGYWIPEQYKRLKYIGDNAVSYFPNININNIDSYLKMSYDKYIYLNYYTNCLTKLKKIETESDIKFYDFFIENHTKYPMFRDNYHPTMNLLEYVGSEIMKKIDTKFNVNYINNFKLVEETMEYGHYKPIVDYIKNILDIKYNLDKIFICSRKEYLSKIINYENSVTNNPVKDLTDMRSKLW